MDGNLTAHCLLPTSPMTRILGLDFGTRRVGAALSDPGRTIAFPLEVYDRRGPEPMRSTIASSCTKTTSSGSSSACRCTPAAARARLARVTATFGDWLAGVTGLPVFYFDERYTTVEAEHRLIDAGLTRQKRKALRDKLAAQIMLQSYLDAGCPESKAAPAPLADPDEA